MPESLTSEDLSECLNYPADDPESCWLIHYPIASTVSDKPAAPEQARKVNEALQPNKENVIAEKSKVIAKLHNKTSPGYTVIDVKKYTLSDDLLNLDLETWILNRRIVTNN